MIKIQLVVPRKDYVNPEWRQFVDSYNEEYFNVSDDSIEYEIEELVIPVDELQEHEYEADVIISRGFLSKTLRELKLKMPVVDIPVQGIDLVRTLFSSREKYGKRKIAVIGAQNMIYGVDNLQDILDLQIERYYLNSLSDIPKQVDTAKEEGCEIVLAGLNTCAYAQKKGLKAEIIQTSVDSFHQALSEAKRLAAVSRKEQKETQRYQTILDNAYEGIIAIDSNQNITAFNNAAQRILLIDEPVLLGENINDIIEKSDLIKLITVRQDYKEDIIKYRSIQLSVKKVPIYLREHKVGDMIAFQDVTGIQEMEKEIRKKIYLRGYVAKHHFEDIISESKLAKQAIEIAKKYSQVESNILIIGETGTGKEMYTQSIHNNSKRRNQPFVAINCAALPENLLESELFGYVEGAFTGALKEGKKGIFELAHGGTLFLDEIGEVSVNLQSRLLRVLQEREVMRIGDDKVIPVDVRIIAATNKNLLDMVKNNTFREDLYYRLSVLNLHLPPLRACKEDIPLLVNSFLQNYSNEPIQITDEALKRISEEKWEGNVRELQNFCERLSVLCQGNMINNRDIDMNLPQVYTKINTVPDEKVVHVNTAVHEKDRIMMALKENNFRRNDTAEYLGMSRATLWRKLKRYGIEI